MLSGGLRPLRTTLVFSVAILAGAAVAVTSPSAADAASGVTDHVVLLLVALLFLDVRFDGLRALARAPRTVLPAIGCNFLLVPVIAAALAPLLPEPAVRLGFVVYCLAPCTDWFLGFTRLARGDTAVGAALLPVQMVLQLLLYPVWIAVATGTGVPSTLQEIGPTLLTWFVLPAGVGLALKAVLRVQPSERLRAGVQAVLPTAVTAVIAVLILCLFAANTGTVLAHPDAFLWLLPVVFLFFVTTFVLGEGLGRLLRLRPPEQVLLTMTTSARNAPLMLALTTVALPGRPVVAAAIVLGMLVEFPHLTALAHLALRRARTPRNRRSRRTRGTVRARAVPPVG